MSRILGASPRPGNIAGYYDFHCTVDMANLYTGMQSSECDRLYNLPTPVST